MINRENLEAQIQLAIAHELVDETDLSLIGAKTVVTKGAFVQGTPNVVGVAGDWSQAMWGTVEGVKIDFSSDATLDIDAEHKINLFQQNMFAVRAEIEVGFRADTSVFNALTATSVPSV